LTNLFTGSVLAATAVTDDTGMPAPTAPNDGYSPPSRDTDLIAWYFDLNALATDSCTVTPWYWDTAATKWIPGKQITVNQANGCVILQKVLGERVDLQLASVTGTIAVRFRWASAS
jgi:hypothetical protein